MTKEMEFFIYLIEKYSEHKNISTTIIMKELEELDLIDYIYNMYELYHMEAIENAFNDIDKLIKKQKNK